LADRDTIAVQVRFEPVVQSTLLNATVVGACRVGHREGRNRSLLARESIGGFGAVTLEAARADAKKKAAPIGDKPTKLAASLFAKRPRNFSLGGDLQPKRDVTRFVKWPAYIKLQRQKRVLEHRLKIPPTINQFTRTLDKNHAVSLFKLLHKYRPETKKEKLVRQKAIAADKAAGKKAAMDPTKKPLFVKYGINHITRLVEQKEAKLVVIAHDVQPVELVLWLPALCRQQGVPFCIVKNKSRLGQVVGKKQCTALAIDAVSKDDAAALAQLTTFATENYNALYDETRKQHGGQKNGIKSVTKMAKRAKALEREAAAARKL